jgi:hypothetical protein
MANAALEAFVREAFSRNAPREKIANALLEHFPLCITHSRRGGRSFGIRRR